MQNERVIFVAPAPGAPLPPRPPPPPPPGSANRLARTAFPGAAIGHTSMFQRPASLSRSNSVGPVTPAGIATSTPQAFPGMNPPTFSLPYGSHIPPGPPNAPSMPRAFATTNKRGVASTLPLSASPSIGSPIADPHSPTPAFHRMPSYQQGGYPGQSDPRAASVGRQMNTSDFRPLTSPQHVTSPGPVNSPINSPVNSPGPASPDRPGSAMSVRRISLLPSTGSFAEPRPAQPPNNPAPPAGAAAPRPPASQIPAAGLVPAVGACDPVPRSPEGFRIAPPTGLDTEGAANIAIRGSSFGRDHNSKGEIVASPMKTLIIKALIELQKEPEYHGEVRVVMRPSRPLRPCLKKCSEAVDPDAPRDPSTLPKHWVRTASGNIRFSQPRRVTYKALPEEMGRRGGIAVPFIYKDEAQLETILTGDRCSIDHDFLHQNGLSIQTLMDMEM